MPLVRVQVRNEYGLGLPELYSEANREDPKAVLDGVAVAGLVGILRQLGDLAEFAAEVFHGLQEQVMTTASRSHKLRARVQRIEAALPPLEKAVLAQKSHIHFAYTAGSDWHPRIRNEQNHFIYNDLPRFIMDSYEECREPPRLHLLDKFDTGGPGSCLKRYSDPTFFKRVSASSNAVNAEKVQRDRKTRKTKKKRSWQRNGEVSHGASVSNHSGRMQFFSPNIPEQTSPAHTGSTFDMTLKSDLGDQSNSFGSRAGSGYIECVFNLSSSMQPDEQEPKSSSSRLDMQNNNTLGSVFPDEETGVADDDFPRSSLQEPTVPSSSCVTWDEKTEIVEPMGPRSDSDEALDMLLENSDLDEQARGVVNLKNVDQIDILLDDQNTPKSISDGDELNEIESEPDNYMDALNTIESESENDFDCQTKREVELYSYNSNNEVIEDGIHELKAHNSDHHPSEFEFNTASYSPSTKGVSQNLPGSVSLECFAHGQSPEIAGPSSNPDSSAGISFCGSADMFDGSKLESVVSGGSAMFDGSKLESVSSDPLSSGSQIPNSQAPSGNKVITEFCQSQESLAEFSGTPSVKFWTNGGLLGLEPSKPPDCSILNAVRQDSLDVSKDDTIGPSSHIVMPKGDGDLGKVDNLVKNSKSIENNSSSKYSTSGGSIQDVISTKNASCGFSPADLDTKLEKSGDSQQCNRFNHTHGCDLNETSVVTPGTELPVADDVKASSTEAGQVNDGSSSGVFGLRHRLLVNGFRRNASLARDDKSGLASSVKTGVFEKSGHYGVAYQTFPEKTFEEEFDRGSPVNSVTSSPPLEHMKISFHPINGFETSKLKLKFPDGSHCHDSTRDMFPSFQLVPEPAILLHDIGSDSDDDTFCRSSPYMSDDCLSHHSDSNSEQWESGETPGSKDHELYDSLCRISSMESISGSPELEGTANGHVHVGCELNSYAENAVEPSQSGLSLDLPSFDAMNPSLKQEMKSDSYPNDLIELQYPKEPMPPPPPLPPLQWRVSNPHLDAAEDKQDAVSEALSHPFDPKPLGSILSQQTKPAPAKQQHNTKESIAFTPISKQQDWQKLNGQKEDNQAANNMEVDEREDFLQQIRTKSFSLRRTVTARPNFTPGPTTNVKVTAILEKANAIRQAVGSDDGEDDDNWSDA